jgi:hypothetical protein
MKFYKNKHQIFVFVFVVLGFASRCQGKIQDTLQNSLSFISNYPLNNLSKLNDDVNNNLKKIGNLLLNKSSKPEIIFEIKSDIYYNTRNIKYHLDCWIKKAVIL